MRTLGPAMGGIAVGGIMGHVVRADAALFGRIGRDRTRVVETPSGAVLSWAALHLLAEHGYRWRPSGEPERPDAPVGDLLHVDLTIEHAPSGRLVLGATPARFLQAFGRTVTYAPDESAEPWSSSELTARAERRAPTPTTVVVGSADDAVGGILVVERGPRTVFETLRVVVAIRDRRTVRDGLEAGLQSVSLGRHPQSGLFSTSRGRLDGVTDPVLRGPTTPLAVFAGARAVRARDLAGRAADLGGRPVGSARAPGFVFWFAGDEPDRWRAAADLARGVRGSGLRRTPSARDDDNRTGEVR
ncbi:DUF6177 family protein [Curtobacterium sp. NPDC090223]|uniref:DUF6177 family protein n=2 Tax=unclassified Curtobacterium TaxID=257496 RepID=UPI00381EA598